MSEACRLRALEKAVTYIGVHEDPPGSNRGKPEIERWQHWANGLTGYPWCAAFACGMVREACELIVPTPGRAGVENLYRWAQETGELLEPGTRPRRGDWILYDWEHDNWHDHIGIVERVLAGRWTKGRYVGSVRTIEGNVSDAVRRKYRSVSGVQFVRVNAAKLTPVKT